MKPEEKSVFLKISLGSQPAFEELVNEYASSIKKIAFSFLNDIHFAEDIAQEVFLKIYERIDQLLNMTSSPH